MSNNLYQLYSKRKYVPGEYFAVNGPYDTHGYVVKFIKQETDGPYRGRFLHLIRGISNAEYERRF